MKDEKSPHLTNSLNSIDWESLCQYLSAECRTNGGRVLGKHLTPPSTYAAIQTAYDQVVLFSQLDEAHLAIDLTPCDRLEALLETLSSGYVLQSNVCLDVVEFISTCKAIHERLEAIIQDRDTREKSHGFLPAQEYWSKLIDFILERISFHGELKEDASPKLADLSRQETKDRGALEKALASVTEKYAYQSMLMDRFVTLRDGRYVLPVKMQFHKQVKGIIHDLSNSKKTSFIEPFEIVKINNHLVEVLQAKQEERLIILRVISEVIIRNFDDLKVDLEWLHKLDLIRAKIRLGKLLQGTLILPEPLAQRWPGMTIREMRHPLLVLQGESVVANTVILSDESRGLVVSGPNMGGKTILLKSIGSIVAMSYCGIPVPCDAGSKIPHFSWWRLVVGDQQSVQEGISSFAFQVEMLKEMPKKKGWGLLIADELMGSTDPEEGEVLAQALLESWAKSNRVIGFVSTHFTRVKALSVTGKLPFMYGSMAYEKGLPTYLFLDGSIGQSFGIEMARAKGMPESIVEKAKAYLGEEKLKLHDLMAAMQAKVAQVDRQSTAMINEKKGVQDKLNEVEALTHQLKEDRKVLEVKILHEVWQSYESTLKEMREWLSKEQKTRKAFTGLEKKAQTKIDQVRENITDLFTAEQPKPGDCYMIPYLGKVIVIEWCQEKGYALVQCKNKRLRLALEHFANAKKAE